MEKLELKHIAGYLPYALKVKTGDKINTMVAGEEYLGIGSYFTTISEIISFNDVLPILRPLSDLTKEIEINGEKFVPIDFLEGMFGDCSKLTDTMLVNSFVPYGIVKKLYEWHFDIHGLIEKGLAIDKNTLK